MCAYKPRKIITFVKLKSTIGSSYMFVHTCCCIGVFILSGLIQNSKRIQKSICKFALEIWKENDGEFTLPLFLLGRSPARPRTPRGPVRSRTTSLTAGLAEVEACAALPLLFPTL